MKKNQKIIYKIDKYIIKDYVEIMNFLTEPMSDIKSQLNLFMKNNVVEEDNAKKFYNAIVYDYKKAYKKLIPIINMKQAVNNFFINDSNEKYKIYYDIILQLMKSNNGMLSTRMIEPLDISRQYLSMMVKDNHIEKISRGIYILPNVFEDSYYSFQQKYKKAIFSHMNALYFYGLTEEFPYNYTVSVPQSYHVDTINEKCNVFYVSNDIYGLGLTEINTPNGNKVRVYDKERCICDIIRSCSRLDEEQVRKTIKLYRKRKDKDLPLLIEYSTKMGIYTKVMKYVGDIYYD